MKSLKLVLGPMRPPFLVLAPVCVFLGISSALWMGGSANVWYIILVLVGAVSAHISVNALNEYFDFKSGLDFRTTRTPFSGGSGTLPANPEAARYALLTGLFSAALTALIGLVFLQAKGIGILPLGVLGLLVIFTYTVWINRLPALCLIAPGLGFGILMVMGTDFVLTGHYSWTSFFASLVPFFLVNNLLLLNQFPDVEADQSVGRRTLPITAGKPVAAGVYAAFILLTYISIIVGVALKFLPVTTLLGLGSALVAIPVAMGVHKNALGAIEKLLPLMGKNVVINLLTPTLTGIGFLLGLLV